MCLRLNEGIEFEIYFICRIFFQQFLTNAIQTGYPEHLIANGMWIFFERKFELWMPVVVK
jgi:hypothetical protein